VRRSSICFWRQPLGALLSTWFLLGPGVVSTPTARASIGIAPGVRRILVLGDSITYGGRYVDYLETYLRLRMPARKVEILNLGLPSETVSGLSEPGHAKGKFPRPNLHERLGRVLSAWKPDLVVACYGMNDGIYQPLSKERFGRFRAGIERLRSKVAAAGAAILHVTPPVFDEVGAAPAAAGYDEVLRRYARWLISQRAAGWDVVDVHEPMRRLLANQRSEDASFRLAPDGIHPEATGHWLMARAILLHWGAQDLDGAERPDDMLLLHPRGRAVWTLVSERQALLKDAWLTTIGHLRPGMKPGLPLAEAQTHAVALENRVEAILAHP